MNCRVYRFLAALLLAFLIAVACDADGETDCNEDAGECANPEAGVPEVEVKEPAPEDPNCPSRESIIRCAGAHLDSNQNGKLERTELQAAIDKLPWYSRGMYPSSFAGFSCSPSFSISAFRRSYQYSRLGGQDDEEMYVHSDYMRGTRAIDCRLQDLTLLLVFLRCRRH